MLLFVLLLLFYCFIVTVLLYFYCFVTSIFAALVVELSDLVAVVVVVAVHRRVPVLYCPAGQSIFEHTVSHKNGVVVAVCVCVCVRVRVCACGDGDYRVHDWIVL